METRRRPNILQRKYLINKTFQLKYTSMVVAACSVIYLLLGYYFYSTTLDNTDLLAIQNLEMKGMVEEEDNYVLWALIFFFLLQISSLFMLGTLITHKIVGPTFRFTRQLADMAGGKFLLMRALRKGDEFQEFVEQINGVTTYVRSGAEYDIAQLNSLDQDLGQVGNDPQKLSALREKIAAWRASKEKILAG